MTDYNALWCKQKHEEEDRRITMLETNYKDMSDRNNDSLLRLHSRLDEIMKEAVKRLPPWATWALTAMGMIAAACLTAALKH